MTSREQATSMGDESVVVTRELDAPREVVFKTFKDPDLMAQWFAPPPLTVPRSESDFRPGGRYTLVMRDEDGNDYTSTGVYREIVESERIVYTDSLEEMPSGFIDMLNEARGEATGTPVAEGVVTVTLEDVGAGRTRLTFREDFDTKATRDAFVEMQMVEGLDGGFDNMERLLVQMQAMAR